MKNREWWLGVLALAFLFGMTVIGCIEEEQPINRSIDPRFHGKWGSESIEYFDLDGTTSEIVNTDDFGIEISTNSIAIYAVGTLQTLAVDAYSIGDYIFIAGISMNHWIFSDNKLTITYESHHGKPIQRYIRVPKFSWE